MALDAETVPLLGAVAPVQVTGTPQLAPLQPMLHVPHVYPLASAGMQPTVLWMQGSGVQPMVTKVQVGAVPLHVPADWQVCMAVPVSA